MSVTAKSLAVIHRPAQYIYFPATMHYAELPVGRQCLPASRRQASLPVASLSGLRPQATCCCDREASGASAALPLWPAQRHCNLVKGVRLQAKTSRCRRRRRALCRAGAVLEHVRLQQPGSHQKQVSLGLSGLFRTVLDLTTCGRLRARRQVDGANVNLTDDTGPDSMSASLLPES